MREIPFYKDYYDKLSKTIKEVIKLETLSMDTKTLE
jgi:hypothetical protein